MRRTAPGIFLSSFGLFLLVCLTAAAHAQTFPQLTGRVVDAANVLDAAAEARLDGRLRALEAQSSDQLVVVTLPSLQGYEIADYGTRLARNWRIGQQVTNNGTLLIVAPNERRVRIEVGYGLEGTLTDALSSVIIQQSILPRFRAGDVPGGIERGVEDIVKVLTGDAAEVAARAKARPEPEEGSEIDLVTLLVLGIVLFIVLRAFMSGGGRGRRRRGGSPMIFLPGGFGGGGGGSGGGSFSGGGGSFGGGGASGEW